MEKTAVYTLTSILLVVMVSSVFSPRILCSDPNPPNSGCTVFTASCGDTVLLGSNLDHPHNLNSFLWFYPSSTQDYGVVRHGFLSEHDGEVHYSYEGGMNDQGLCLDANGLPEVPLNPHPERPFSWRTHHLFHLILRKCSNVTEAVDTVKKCDWGNSMAIQLHLADSTGDAVVISPGPDGELSFARKEEGDGYLVSTNFNRANPENHHWDYPSPRYETAAAMLEQIEHEDHVNRAYFESILDTVRFESAHTNTIYSYIYDLRNGVIYLYYFHQFEEVAELNPIDEIAKGERILQIRDLFSQETRDRALAEYRAWQMKDKMTTIIFIAAISFDIGCVIVLIGKMGKYRQKEESERQNMLLYFLLSLAWTWTFWGIAMLESNNDLYLVYIRTTIQPSSMYHSLAVFTILGGLGPLVAASALTFLTGGKEGVSALLRRGGDVGFDKIWWIPIFIAFPLVFAVSYLLFGLVQTVPVSGLIQTVPIYLFFGSSIAGEYGWRGYALDQLQSRFNALISSLIIGIVWSFWYLPLFFTVGAPQYGWFFPFFVVLTMLASIMFTWLHNNTAGSILTALVLHTSLYFMFSLSSNSMLQTDLGYAIVILVMTIATASVTTYWGPGRLVTRDRSMNRKA